MVIKIKENHNETKNIYCSQCFAIKVTCVQIAQSIYLIFFYALQRKEILCDTKPKESDLNMTFI